VARNASGTHTLPTGNPVVAGTTADPVSFNATMSDLSAEITDSLSRSGKGGMSAPLVHTAGSATAPSVTFTGDTDTGVYASAANEVAITTGGTQRLKVSSAGVAISGGAVALTATGATANSVTSSVADGGASVALTINTVDPLTTTAKLLSLQNNDVEKVAVDQAGKISCVGLAAGSQKITGVANGTVAGDVMTYSQLPVASNPLSLVAGTDWTVASLNVQTFKSPSTVTGLVVVRGTATAATPVASAAWSSVAIIPEGARPGAATEAIGRIVVSGTSYLATISIATSGVISVQAYDNGTAVVTPLPAIADGATVTVTTTFVGY